MTLYRLSGSNTSITATLPPQALLYKPLTHQGSDTTLLTEELSGLLAIGDPSLCIVPIKWRPPWGINFNTPYPTQVKKQKEIR
ncbi:uncharacterized protein G2W53_028993 [Senna tora]|uniref:Uncharacterized protein n=1 Tax=Senna tora TaxID=362788 RepID=A0A834TD78_9FABA|nr:uncharacterized protein G2W53_028993 [Senna tora]